MKNKNNLKTALLTTLIATLFTLMFMPAIALASTHSATGWAWYSTPETRPVPVKKPAVMTMTRTEPNPVKKPPQPQILTPTQAAAMKELADWKAQYAAIKAQATLHPNTETVYSLMKMNNVSIQHASQMELYWRENLLLHPELNDEAVRPSQGIAHQQYLVKQNKKIHDSVVAFVREGYVLFYAFKEDDIYGGEFAKQIQQFADDEGFPLLGVSMDNSDIAGIRKVRNNEGKLDISVTPQLLLFNPQSKTLTTVVAGVTTLDSITRNMHLIATHFKDDE